MIYEIDANQLSDEIIHAIDDVVNLNMELEDEEEEDIDEYEDLERDIMEEEENS